MCDIIKGKYYISRHTRAIVQATESVHEGLRLFKGILVEDPNNSHPHDLNIETTNWNTCAFNECEYNAALTNNELFPIY